ncbi:MAG TPA: ABC transporter permease [Thermoanaerobaculaceae bacterium]|nr:ABC transporter permease [Thermoanaerobaculaceae bacterium]HRS15229.1 ABC transporter permease [Thermoanaerobaculaceae bacterium]
MIGPILKASLLHLRRDRVVQALTFLLPIAFFSVFALVFGGRGGTEVRVDVGVVDEDASPASARLLAALEKEKGLQLRREAKTGDARQPLDRERARALVRGGQLDAAVVVPNGFGAAFPALAPGAPEVEVLADPSNPIAAQMVVGLLQKVGMTAMPDLFVRGSMEAFKRHAGALTPQQRLEARAQDGAGGGGEAEAMAGGLVRTKVVDVIRERAPRTGIIAFYAAGVGVMFLLFSASGAGGALLEEAEAGTLERLLTSRLGMGRLLAAKWVYLTLLGFAQVTVMFVWGALVFGLDLRSHLGGFAIMTAVTAAAASGFGLVLATLCRTRQQLGGLSTIVILIMSAVGGSMFPRFLMSETMQKAGLLTFNGWALDGYLKVFWRNAPTVELWPQVLVLALLAAAFMLAARLLARRWEAA